MSDQSLSVGSLVDTLLKSAKDAPVNEIAKVVYDLAKTVREREATITQRMDIEASARVRLREIDAQREVLLAFFDNAFKQRSEVFALEFNALDQALAQNNTDAVAAVLNTIVATVKSSPLGEAGEIRQMLSRGTPLKLE